jgi:hypothetical protein
MATLPFCCIYMKVGSFECICIHLLGLHILDYVKGTGCICSGLVFKQIYNRCYVISIEFLETFFDLIFP